LKSLKLAKFEPLYAKEAIAQLKHVLEYPKFYNESYDDINPRLDKEGKPMMNEHQFFDFTLKELQNDDASPYEQAHIDRESKQWENKYKKYVKEWKKKNGTN
jgi:hypothetical protein